MLVCEKVEKPYFDKKELLWILVLRMNDKDGIGRYDQIIKFAAIESYKNWMLDYLATKNKKGKEK